jgi:hypothetical protein
LTEVVKMDEEDASQRRSSRVRKKEGEERKRHGIERKVLD